MDATFFWRAVGGTNNGRELSQIFCGVPNVYLTDNPDFTKADFLETFPVFESSEIPDGVFDMFLSMANASIKEKRYKSQWKYLMCLYIAHFVTLYLQTQTGNPEAADAVAAAMPRGVAVSKSVDGLSISYDFQDTADLAGYGTWTLTTYGRQLATLTKAYGAAGMWVNG